MIKRLAAYIGKYKKYVIVSPFLVTLDAFFELTMPLLMAKIVDVGIVDKDINFIARFGLYMILLALGAMAFGILNMRFTTVASMGFGANLRDALFEKIQAFSFSNIDHFSTASLITRLTNDVNNLQMTFMMALRLLLRGPIMLTISFILAYSINPQLSMVMAVAIPLLVIGVVSIMRAAISRYAAVQETIDGVNTILQENLIGIRVVKSFVTEKHEINKFQKANDNLTDAAIRAASIAILVMPMMVFVMDGATLAIIWLGGHMVYFGSLGAGEFISFFTYVMHILFSVMLISMVILMSARAKASGDRVVEVLETRIDIEEKQPVSKPAPELPAALPVVHDGRVEFRDVSFRYSLSGNGENVLSNISFTAQSGQVIGIVGGTGTGKTTLVHLIPRLYDVSDGKVLVGGIDVRDYPLEVLRAGIGMVLQKNTLFAGTIRENLLWGNSQATQEEIETACKDAQAHGFIMSFPNGYDTHIEQGGVNISGGQKQRLCIARAMLKKPKILILDDSTSSVDSHTEGKIRESFYRNLSNTTVFIIAQRISSVREADQIIVLDDGKIVGIGTHETLMASNVIYQEINASQQEGVLVHA